MTIDHQSLAPELTAFIDAISRQFGDRVDAIILYGSWRRGGQLTIPDFYVLLNAYPTRWWHWPSRLLPPVVFLQETNELHAKVSVLTTAQLCSALSRGFHSYFWARFAQPIRLVLARNDLTHQFVDDLQNLAQRRLIGSVSQYWVTGALPPAAEFWSHTFQLTYGAELRPEKAARINDIYRTDIAYYDELYDAFAATHECTEAQSRWTQFVWRFRQAFGKLLSVARLLKSVLTFHDPLNYVAWKVGRQSGVLLKPSARARRWPLLFGWGYIWRLYRLGAFR